MLAKFTRFYHFFLKILCHVSERQGLLLPEDAAADAAADKIADKVVETRHDKLVRDTVVIF